MTPPPSYNQLWMQLLHGDNPGKSGLSRPSHRPSHCPVTAHLSFYPPPSPPISFNNVPVAAEDEIRLLSVIFDRHLSFRSHLRSIASKANQRMHFFKKVAPLLDVAGKLCLYKGFVRPTMEDNFLTWMGASESSLKLLDRVQHRALRLIGPGVVLRARRSLTYPTGVWWAHYATCIKCTASILRIP